MAPPFSSTMTFAPFCAAVVAATRPPLPAPTTTRSASSVSAMSVGIAGLSRQLPCAASASEPDFEALPSEACGAQPASAPAAASAPVAVSPARKLRRLMAFSPVAFFPMVPPSLCGRAGFADARRGPSACAPSAQS